MFCYLDNAATSYPKPYSVVRDVENTVKGPYGNPGRSGHFLSRNSADKVFNSRIALSEFIGLDSPENIIFTHNATYALNIAIIGTVNQMLKKCTKPLVITDVFEHNSVLRPLYKLEHEGKIKLKIISPGTDRTSSIVNAIPNYPCLAVITALSNTAGDEFDTKLISEKIKKSKGYLIVDASQLLGSVPFDIYNSGADIVCAPCHKGLHGIMGSGFAAFNDKSNIVPSDIISGGAGSDSGNHFMPDYLPDMLEAGTLAVPAISSVVCGIDFLRRMGIENIEKKEAEEKAYLISELSNMPKVTLYGKNNKHGPVLFNINGINSSEVGDYLDKKQIAVRTGFHCAPLSHEYYKTGVGGAVRVSPGPLNTKGDLRYFIDKLYSFITADRI